MKDQLIKLLSDSPLDLHPGVFPELAAESLILYLKEWKRWNAKINLTAECHELSVVDKHIYESLQYSRAISPAGLLLDIGSGAGFPGIPIKIVRPSLEVVLIESQRKRANFLKSVIRAIGLSGIRCIHERVEDFSEFQRAYDFVTLRHVLEPTKSLQLGERFLKSGGILVLQTSCNNSFISAPNFLNSHCFSLVDEIIFQRSSSAHSKIVVLKRNLI